MFDLEKIAWKPIEKCWYGLQETVSKHLNYSLELFLRYYYMLNRFRPEKTLFKGLSNIKFGAFSYILSMPSLELWRYKATELGFM